MQTRFDDYEEQIVDLIHNSRLKKADLVEELLGLFSGDVFYKDFDKDFVDYLKTYGYNVSVSTVKNARARLKIDLSSVDDRDLDKLTKEFLEEFDSSSPAELFNKGYSKVSKYTGRKDHRNYIINAIYEKVAEKLLESGKVYCNSSRDVVYVSKEGVVYDLNEKNSDYKKFISEMLDTDSSKRRHLNVRGLLEKVGIKQDSKEFLKMSYYDKKNYEIYVYSGNHKIMKIGDDYSKIEKDLPNGHNDMLFDTKLSGIEISKTKPRSANEFEKYVIGAPNILERFGLKQQRELLEAFVLCLFFDNEETDFKNFLLLQGPQASGKSSFEKGLGYALVGSDYKPDVVADNQVNFVTSISHRPFVQLDNVDTIPKYLPVLMSQLTSGTKVVKKKNYTDGELFETTAFEHVVVGSREPFSLLKDHDDVIYRLIPILTDSRGNTIDSKFGIAQIQERVKVASQIVMRLTNLLAKVKENEGFIKSNVKSGYRNQFYLNVLRTNLNAKYEKNYADELFESCVETLNDLHEFFVMLNGLETYTRPYRLAILMGDLKVGDTFNVYVGGTGDDPALELTDDDIRRYAGLLGMGESHVRRAFSTDKPEQYKDLNIRLIPNSLDVWNKKRKKFDVHN